MFNWFKKKKDLPYEEFGYIYADSLSSSLIDQLSQSASDWIGRPADSKKVGLNLSILSTAIFQLSLGDLIPNHDASGRALGGFMKRLTEQYDNLTSDSDATTLCTEYIRAAAADSRNKHKNESFPTLVSLAITKTTGLSKDNEYWPAASEVIYSLIKNVFETSRATLAGTKDDARLV